MITPITGPLTSGMKSIAVKSAAITPQAGSSSGSSQSGSDIATIASAASLIGGNRLISRTAPTLPSSAPAPIAVKKSPATLESPEKLS